MVSSIDSVARYSSYIEGFAAAGKEHICREQLVSNGFRAINNTPQFASPFDLQAPTTARVDPSPPTPYFKLIFAGSLLWTRKGALVSVTEKFPTPWLVSSGVVAARLLIASSSTVPPTARLRQSQALSRDYC